MKHPRERFTLALWLSFMGLLTAGPPDSGSDEAIDTKASSAAGLVVHLGCDHPARLPALRRGTNDLVIKSDLPCAPCNMYPHYQYGGSYIRCKYRGTKQGWCMRSISVDEVYQTIIQNYADILGLP